MPLKAVEPRRLYRQIAQQISDSIRNGEFSPGQRLPAERELSVLLKVSRASVREALIALEVQGLVEVRTGSGVYVTNSQPQDSVALPHDSGPFELIEARKVIESECAALAAKHATPAQRKAMADALARMARDAKAGSDPLVGDREFHLRIAEASGNSALLLAVQTLWEQRAGPLFSQLEYHFNTPALWKAAITEHAAVLEAIRHGDPKAARAAMREHMKMAAKRFSEGF